MQYFAAYVSSCAGAVNVSRINSKEKQDETRTYRKILTILKQDLNNYRNEKFSIEYTVIGFNVGVEVLNFNSTQNIILTVTVSEMMTTQLPALIG